MELSYQIIYVGIFKRIFNFPKIGRKQEHFAKPEKQKQTRWCEKELKLVLNKKSVIHVYQKVYVRLSMRKAMATIYLSRCLTYNSCSAAVTNISK